MLKAQNIDKNMLNIQTSRQQNVRDFRAIYVSVTVSRANICARLLAGARDFVYGHFSIVALVSSTFFCCQTLYISNYCAASCVPPHMEAVGTAQSTFHCWRLRAHRCVCVALFPACSSTRWTVFESNRQRRPRCIEWCAHWRRWMRVRVCMCREKKHPRCGGRFD